MNIQTSSTKAALGKSPDLLAFGYICQAHDYLMASIDRFQVDAKLGALRIDARVTDYASSLRRPNPPASANAPLPITNTAAEISSSLAYLCSMPVSGVIRLVMALDSV